MGLKSSYSDPLQAPSYGHRTRRLHFRAGARANAQSFPWFLHCSRDDDDDDDDDNNNAVGDGADDGEGSHGEDDDGKGGKLTSMCRTTLPTVMPMPLVMIRHGASLVLR